MWWKKKKEIPIDKVIEEPKPTSYTAVMEMTLVNNRTDKEYVIKSENNFGLKWTYFEDDKGKQRYSILCIQQYRSLNHNDWKSIGRFLNFSIISMRHETFDIPNPIPMFTSAGPIDI